jgi:hypothetical protein
MPTLLKVQLPAQYPQLPQGSEWGEEREPVIGRTALGGLRSRAGWPS